MFIRLCLFVLLCSFLVSCGEATTDSGQTLYEQDSLRNLHRLDSIKVLISAERKTKELKNLVEKKIKKGLNGSVLIAQRGVILIDTLVGFANFEDSLTHQKDIPFQLASLSKTFTSIAILKLVEEGKLSLELTVKDYFPEFPYDGVTLRSLLSHRSGLPYYEYNFDRKAIKERLKPDNQMLIKWIEQADPAPKRFHPSDHYFSYNNLNYAILAAIVEKVTKTDFGQFLEDKIFQPLDMTNSRVVNELNDSLPRTYGYQNGRRIPYDIFDNVLGDKGVFSTSHDLLKWYDCLRSEKLIHKEILREAYTPRSFEYPGLRNYGYGFRLWLNDKQQTDYVYHTGWWKGYNSIMFFDLRDDFVIIILSNRYNRDVYHVKEMIDVLHGGSRITTVEENILDE